MIKDFVAYKDFGAKGDGKTDDMSAIALCHEYANKYNIPVVAGEGEYYIGSKDITAIIMTDTDFSGAKFIIDDSAPENIRQHCFWVKSDAERFTPDISSVSVNQKKIDFPHSGNVYVRVFSDKRVYIRKGLNKNNGTDAADSFIVDNEGNVGCGINWEYEKIKDAYAFSVDDKPVTIRGGSFTTKANRAEAKYNYHERNILITRSNVTVEGLTHSVTGEGEHGAPYSGFICVNECSNITLRGCRFTPHKTYYTESQIPGEMVPMGSYELNFYAVIGLKLENISQTIDICDERYWGLMGSNFCKNVSLDACTMSRFDAHCGVTGGEIKNCLLGHMGVHLIGFGEFLIESTTVYNRHFVTFRDDYGANFNGELIIRSCTWKPASDNRAVYNLFQAVNEGDHDFGYYCTMPQTIVIDNMMIDDSHIKDNCRFVILGNYDSNFADNKPYPYGIPENVTVNITSASGRDIEPFADPLLYKGLKVNFT